MRLAFLLVTPLALAGCGQKGPLYLPDAGGEVITRPMTPPPAAAPAPATDAPEQGQPSSTNKGTEGR